MLYRYTLAFLLFASTALAQSQGSLDMPSGQGLTAVQVNALINAALVQKVDAASGVASNLTLSGTTTAGNINSTGSITAVSPVFSGTTSLSNLNATGSTTLNNVTINGTLTAPNFTGNSGGSSFSTNNPTFTGTTSVAALTASGTINAPSPNFTGTTTVQNLTVTGTLTAPGVSQGSGSSTFSTASPQFTGTTSVANLNASGNTALTNLIVSGTTQAASPVFTGNTTVAGLAVSGALSAANPSFSGTTSTSNLNSSGTISGNAITASGALTAGSINTGGAITSTGSMTTHGGLSVQGLTSGYILAAQNSNGNMFLIDANGNASANGAINAHQFNSSGTITAVSPIFTGTTSVANLTVSGTLTAPSQQISKPCLVADTYGADPTGNSYSDNAWTTMQGIVGANGGCIQFSAGTYKFTSNLTWSLTASPASASVIGAGSNNTVLYFPNNPGGLAFYLHSDANNFHVRGLSVVTGQNGQNFGIYASNSVCEERTFHNSIDDVEARGYDNWKGTGASNYWSVGIYTSAVSFIDIDKTDIYGNNSGGIGIQFQGTGSSCYAIVENISNSGFWALGIGYELSNYAQGVQITNSNFTNGTTGVYLPAGTTGATGMSITNSQFNTSTTQIFLNAPIAAAQISNNLLYVSANGTGIEFNGGQQFTVTGNSITGLSTTGTIGVNANAGSTGAITGNNFVTLNYPVALQANSTNWNVESNSYGGNSHAVDNAGAGNIVGVASP